MMQLTTLKSQNILCDKGRTKEKTQIVVTYIHTHTHTQKHTVVQLLSHVQLFATSWAACSTLGFPVLHCLPEFAQAHVH